MDRPKEKWDPHAQMELADGLSEIPPEKISKQEIIGEGGFGTVVKGLHKDWGLLAVKYLKADNIASIHSKKLREEAKVQSKLTHPNIVQLIGIIWAPQNYAVVLEFMVHGALNDFFSEYHQVPWQWKVKMVNDVVLGLNYLHTRKPAIIHQDLKIQNCLVGESFNVKLSDFGLSEWISYSRQHTDHHVKGGTVTHLPPERWVNINAKASFKFDVYSFGILLWEIVTERNPFEGKSDAEISNAVVKGQRPELNNFGPYIPDFLINMMKHSWDPTPEKRPTFGTIKDGLETFLAQNKLEVETAKQHLFRKVSQSSSSASSTPTQSFEDPSLHVQFHSDPEVFEISVDESSERNSNRPCLSGPGHGQEASDMYRVSHRGAAAAEPIMRPSQGITDPSFPIQRVQTNNMSQQTNYDLPIQRQHTGSADFQRGAWNDYPPSHSQLSAQRPLPQTPGSTNGNVNMRDRDAPTGNTGPGFYSQIPTVDLATNRSVPDVGRLEIGQNQPCNIPTGHPSQPSKNVSPGPSMNIDLGGAGTGVINVTNSGIRTSVPNNGRRIVINRTKSGGAGQQVREHTVVSGDTNGQAIQIGNHNVMNVHTGGRAAVCIEATNKKSKVVIKKTITVSCATVDHPAMDTVATHLGKYWKQLARELKFTTGQIDSFENDNKLLYEQIYKMLHDWVQKTGPSASYKVLAEALCKIKKGSVANLLQVSTQEN